MATFIVHGTQTHRSAARSRWWWDAWEESGFVGAMARGMETAGAAPDIWTVDGTPVRDIPAFQPSWSLWRGYSGKTSFGQHQGHFLWDGGDTGVSRDAAASNLAKYLCLVHELNPAEPIRIVTHSHGGNVTKLATRQRRFLKSGIRLESVVFLACPHWDSPGAPESSRFIYRLNPDRVGRALNLYNSSDSVQVEIAAAVKGIPGPRWADQTGIGAEGFRTDQDPLAQSLYEDFDVPMEATGIQAHREIHGAAVGFLTGLWLASPSSPFHVLASQHPDVLPVPLGDNGEGEEE